MPVFEAPTAWSEGGGGISAPQPCCSYSTSAGSQEENAFQIGVSLPPISRVLDKGIADYFARISIPFTGVWNMEGLAVAF